MLKARAGDRLVFGLSAKNIEKLMNGDPILIDLKQLGMEGSVFIFYGYTEESMRQMMEDEGILPPQGKAS